MADSVPDELAAIFNARTRRAEAIDAAKKQLAEAEWKITRMRELDALVGDSARITRSRQETEGGETIGEMPIHKRRELVNELEKLEGNRRQLELDVVEARQALKEAENLPELPSWTDKQKKAAAREFRDCITTAKRDLLRSWLAYQRAAKLMQIGLADDADSDLRETVTTGPVGFWRPHGVTAKVHSNGSTPPLEILHTPGAWREVPEEESWHELMG